MMPKKKYVVDLTEEERQTLEKMLRGGKYGSRKLTRARILLLSDAGKTDAEIVAALRTGDSTVERTRQRFVEESLECLNEHARHGAKPKLSEKQEAHLIAIACSDAPAGRVRWTLSLLAGKVVELGFADSIARETVRQTLKKKRSSRG